MGWVKEETSSQDTRDVVMMWTSDVGPDTWRGAGGLTEGISKLGLTAGVRGREGEEAAVVVSTWPALSGGVSPATGSPGRGGGLRGVGAWVSLSDKGGLQVPTRRTRSTSRPSRPGCTSGSRQTSAFSPGTWAWGLWKVRSRGLELGQRAGCHRSPAGVSEPHGAALVHRL